MANPSTGKTMKRTGRVYYTQVATTPEGEPVMMGTFLFANHPAAIFFLFWCIAYFYKQDFCGEALHM
jgi:hypothetical protein